MNTILDDIIKTKRQEIKAAQNTLSDSALQAEAHETHLVQKKLNNKRDFVAAIQRKITHGQPAIIAEIKKASPSKGVIRPNFSILEIAKEYESYGAACLSVLTDVRYFQGAPLYLRQARMFSTLPILRKDFIISPYQVYESKMMGADAILLIADILDLSELKELEALAHSLDMDVLVELHDIAQLDKVTELNTCLIGINNRNLQDFSVDLTNSVRIVQHLQQTQSPEWLLKKHFISESGFSNHKELQDMQKHNIHGFLIGEYFMRQSSPGKALETLMLG